MAMSMNLFVGRIQIHSLPLDLNLNLNLNPNLNRIRTRTTAFASSIAHTQASASPPNSQLAVEYLVQSCGLSSEKALKASKHIQHLKSFDKADGVLRFLREIGISEADIKTAVSREARILCSIVDKKLRPNIARLQELGFSMEDISGIIACNPYILRTNFVSTINFLMGVLGPENTLFICKTNWLFFKSFEKVIKPNLSFLLEQCGFSPRQLLQLSVKAGRLINCRLDVVKMEVERAEKLGIARSSPNFINALLTVSYQKQCIIDAKLDNLTSMGLSQEEVALMISKAPMLLRVPEKLLGSKMEYLIKETGCDKIDVVKYPALLTYSLEKRLIPRNIVKKLLASKGFPVTKIKFPTFIQLSEEKFVKRFVLPYEIAIPGLCRAYADASTGKIGGVGSFKSIIS